MFEAGIEDGSVLRPVSLWPVSGCRNLTKLKARFNDNKVFRTNTGLLYHKTDFPPNTTIILNGGPAARLVIKVS